MKLIIGLFEGISSKIGKIVDLALEIIANFVKGIGSGIIKVVNAGVQMIIDFINGMANGIRENTPKMIAAVDNLMDAVMEAIAAWFSFGVSRGGELIGKVKEGIESGISGLVQAGKDAVSGFIKGIGEKVAGAVEAAKNLGRKALAALKGALDSNSPSKEFETVGIDADRGLIIGLETMANGVANAAKGVGNSALEGIKDSIAGLADVTGSDIAAEPVIRPVLDLSDIKYGVGQLNSMLGGSAAVSMTANVGAINAGMSGRSQNGNFNDVVKSVDKLGKKLDNVGNTTYIIDGVTYDDGSNVASAVETLIHAVKVDGRT
jgi:hypothetical protein